MSKNTLQVDKTYVAIGVILFLLILRLWMLVLFPLYDTTEARYAEIARLMFETKQWISPQFDYGIPFWGKPPLHTWMSALSFKVFGVSAFTARLPHFVCGITIIVLTYYFVNKISGIRNAIFASLVLCTCLGFIIAIGMVMTDTVLVLSYTLAMISFYKAYQGQNSKINGCIFFFALALGMLSKGPIAIVLVCVALCIWGLAHRNFYHLFSCLPWSLGILVFLLISLPWYVLAEINTPGFLNYFIVGEHFERFVVSGWKGDMYGSAHQKPRGSIWFLWLIAAFPWSFLIIINIIQHTVKYKHLWITKQCNDNIYSYLTCWMFAPVIFFSFSGNILAAYVLPGIPAMAILLSLITRLNRFILLLCFISISLMVSLSAVKLSNRIQITSEVELIGSDAEKFADHSLYYYEIRPYSARFYSRGKAKVIKNISELNSLLAAQKTVYIATKHKNKSVINAMQQALCVETSRTKDRLLFICEGNQ